MENTPQKAKQRTLSQNNALHLYCAMLAETLNDAGLDLRVVLKPEIAIPWTGGTVKDFLWRGVQQSYLGKRSTTELTTKEVNEIYEILNRHLGEKFGITQEFPKYEDTLE